MAELNTTAGDSRRGGVRRSKKASTRVDLTPMVDLGFLLITFFIVTTTWSKPKAMRLIMPANGPESPVGKNAALTLVVLGGERVFYFNGDLESALKEGSYGIAGYGLKEGVGEIIRQKQEAMDKYYKGGRKEMILLIKSSADASYRNVVSLLDETQINAIRRYALTDLSLQEKKAIGEKAAVLVN